MGDLNEYFKDSVMYCTTHDPKPKPLTGSTELKLEHGQRSGRVIGKLVRTEVSDGGMTLVFEKPCKLKFDDGDAREEALRELREVIGTQRASSPRSVFQFIYPWYWTNNRLDKLMRECLDMSNCLNKAGAEGKRVEDVWPFEHAVESKKERRKMVAVEVSDKMRKFRNLASDYKALAEAVEKLLEAEENRG